MLLLKQQIIEFLSTNLEQPYAKWIETATYNAKDYVIYKNHLYQCIVNENINIKPDLNTGKWLLFGVDNAYASVDLRSHTKSELLTDADKLLPYMEFVFSAVGFTYIGFSQVQGSMLEILEYDTAGNLLRTTTEAIGADRVCAINWYNYYFCEIPDDTALGRGKPIDYLFTGILPTTAKIAVRVHKNSDGVASLSAMVGGKAVQIGNTQYGVEIGIIDYSEKKTDEYGITTLTERESREVMTLDIEFPAKSAQAVKREVKAHLGIPIMFIADESTDSLFEHLIMFGYIEDYRSYITNGIIANARMKLEEII